MSWIVTKEGSDTEAALVDKIQPIYFLGELRLFDEIRESESGNCMMNLSASPISGQEGLMCSTNLMFREEWLAEDWSPEIFKVDPIDLSVARKRRKDAGGDLSKLSAEDQELISLGSQKFVFEKNIHHPRGTALLDNILGPEGFKEFYSSVQGGDRDTFAETLKEMLPAAVDEVLMIVYAKQGEDEEGEPTERFQIDRLIRIATETDMEQWKRRHNKKSRVMFDPDAV